MFIVELLLYQILYFDVIQNNLKKQLKSALAWNRKKGQRRLGQHMYLLSIKGNGEWERMEMKKACAEIKEWKTQTLWLGNFIFIKSKTKKQSSDKFALLKVSQIYRFWIWGKIILNQWKD